MGDLMDMPIILDNTGDILTLRLTPEDQARAQNVQQLQSTIQQPLPGTSNTDQVINENTDDTAFEIETVEYMDTPVNLDEQIKLEMTDWEIQKTDLNTKGEISDNMQVDIKTEKDNSHPNVDGDLKTNNGAAESHCVVIQQMKNEVLADKTVVKSEPETHDISDIPNQSATGNTSAVPIDNKNAEKDIAVDASKVDAYTKEEYNAAENNSPAELIEKHQSQEIEHQSQSATQQPLPDTNTNDASSKVKTVENMNQHANLDEQIKELIEDLETEIKEINTEVEISENMEVDFDTERDNTLPNVDDVHTNTVPSELHDSEGVSDIVVEKSVVLAEETAEKAEPATNGVSDSPNQSVANNTSAVPINNKNAEKDIANVKKDKAEPATHGVSDIPNQSVTVNKSTVPIDNNNAEKDIAAVASKVDSNIQEEYNSSSAELGEKNQPQVIDTDETTLPSQVITENNTALPTNETNTSTEEAAVDNTDNITELEKNVPAVNCIPELLIDQAKEAVEQEELELNSNSYGKPIDNLVNENERLTSEIMTLPIWLQKKELYYRALLRFLGLDPDAELKSHRALVELKRNRLPPHEFISELSDCSCIYTTNWPTWTTAFTLRRILGVLTHFDYENGIYLVDMLCYKNKSRMGAFLIRFVKKKDCMLVYDQLRVATLLNPKIKVFLDIGNLISKQIVRSTRKLARSNWWQDPSRPARHRLDSSITAIAPPEDYKEDPHPLGALFKKKTQGPDVPIPTTTPKKGFDYFIPSIAITNIQDLLGLEHGSLTQNKIEVEDKTMDRKISDNIPIPCHAIYMSNCPFQLEIEHYMFILRLLTNFDWNNGIYYIEVLQYSNGANMGSVLIHFASNVFCMKVFDELSRVAILQKGMPEERRIRVQMDLHEIVAKVRKTRVPVDWIGQKLQPVLRARSVLTKLPPRKKCPDIDAILKSLPPKLKEIIQRAQSETDNQQLKQVVNDGDDDDVIIVQAQSVPEIDLTEDDECIDANKGKSDNDLNTSINEKFISVVRNSKENNENTMAKIAALYAHYSPDPTSSKVTPSSQNKTSTASNNQSANMDTTADNMLECGNDTAETCKVVYLKNLPKDKTETILKELIDQLTKFDMKKNMLAIKLLKEPGTNKPTGECLLKFNTHADALEVANSLDGVFVEENIIEAELDIGHKISKSYECDKENTQSLKRTLNSDGQQGQPKRTKLDDTSNVVSNNKNNQQRIPNTRIESRNMDSYGVSKEFLMKIGCKLPLTTFIIVKNLDKKVTEEKLTEVFSLAGNVKQVTLTQEPGKNSARIEYDHPVETVQAVSMFNHQKLYNTEMLVTNDNFVNPLPLGLSGIGKGLGRNGEPITGLRTNTELRQVHEILFEMGRMNKYESKDQPLEAWYTKRANPPAVINTPTGTKIVYPLTKPTTAVALEALGAVLVSLDIIPPGTNCSDLNKIIEALSKNPKFKQKPSRGWEPSSNIQKTAASTSNKVTPPQIHNIPKPKPNAKKANDNPNLTVIPTKQPPPKPPTSNPIADSNYIPLKNTNNNTPAMTPNFNPNIPPPNCNMPGINPNMPPVMHVDQNMQPVMHGNQNMQPMMYGTTNMQQAVYGTPNMQQAMYGTPNMQPMMHWAPNMQAMMQNMQPVMHVDPNMQPVMHVDPNMQAMMQVDPNMQPETYGNPNIPANINMPMNADNSAVWGSINPNPSPRPSTHYSPANSMPPSNSVSPVSAKSQVISVATDSANTTKSTVSKLKEKAQGIKKDEESPVTSTEISLISFHNLPPSVSTVALTAKMKEVGELQFAEVLGNGRALVRFKENSATERCIRLFHRSKVDGHTIDVSLI